MIRGRNAWSIYSPWLNYLIPNVPIITIPGFLGLLLATFIGYWICKSQQYKSVNLLVAFVLVILTNEFLTHNFRFIDFRSPLFEGQSLHLLFATNVLLSLIAGTISLLFIRYFPYFKYSNPGGSIT
jgi:hypothetical protein